MLLNLEAHFLTWIIIGHQNPTATCLHAKIPLFKKKCLRIAFAWYREGWVVLLLSISNKYEIKSATKNE